VSARRLVLAAVLLLPSACGRPLGERARIDRLKALAAGSPVSPAAASAIVDALRDPSARVREVVAVAFLANEEAARLVHVAPPWDTPNPPPVPPSRRDPGGLLVAVDPWFAATTLPATIDLVRHEPGPFRLVAIRAAGELARQVGPDHPGFGLLREALEEAGASAEPAVAAEAAHALASIGPR
jgi:hypothetical protein